MTRRSPLRYFLASVLLLAAPPPFFVISEGARPPRFLCASGGPPPQGGPPPPAREEGARPRGPPRDLEPQRRPQQCAHGGDDHAAAARQCPHGRPGPSFPARAR